MGERADKAMAERKRDGIGRQGTARIAARERGDLDEYERLKPPSEQRLTDEARCGARTQNGTPCKAKKGARTEHPGYGNCAQHGGNTEAGIKSAMREMGADFINEYKQVHLRFGGNRHDPSIANMTPESALLEEVRRSAAMVRFLEERIAVWTLSPATEESIQALFHRHGVASAKTDAEPENRQFSDDKSLRNDVKAVLDSLDPSNPDFTGHLPQLTEVNKNTGITSFTDQREWLYLYREERGHLARVAKMCIDAGVAARLVSLAEDQGRILASAIRAVLTALSLTPEQAAMVPQIVPPILRAVAHDQPIPSLAVLTAGTHG